MKKACNTSGLEKTIEYPFKNKSLLETALTHSSYLDDVKDKISHNERLEFLGDSVLNISISDYLYTAYPDLPEGGLTRIRAGVVSELSLSEAAVRIDIGRYLCLGKAAESSGGREQSSILADCFEALIGAIYLDGGIDAAKHFVLKQLTSHIGKAATGQSYRDYKTELQEYFQKETDQKIRYVLLDEEGPDHNKTFHMGVMVGQNLLGRGKGKSKKEAEQDAAQKVFLALPVKR